jgi:glycosyltransferase involved in cell wall biosynthesis
MLWWTSVMNVLHLVAPAAFGGLERVVRALAVGHGDRGHDVHVALSVEPERASAIVGPWADASAVTVHPIALPARAYRAERVAVRRICAGVRPTVIHTHGYRPDLTHGAAGRALGIPMVSTHHGFTGGSWKNRIYQRLQVGALRRFDAVVAVSHPLASDLARRGVPGDRVRCIQNAWMGSEPPLPRQEARAALGIGETFCIGWVGRLAAEKQPDMLLRAMALLGDLPVHAAVVGDGPQRRALHRSVLRGGLGERVHWCGAVDRVARCYRAFDAFVLSSRTEGTPITLFEAMAAEVPVVATRVGGIPDVVTSEHALLVDPGDPAALADAIRRVFRHREAAAARARAALHRLDRDFRLAPWLTRYEDLYVAVQGAHVEAAGVVCG